MDKGQELKLLRQTEKREKATLEDALKSRDVVEGAREYDRTLYKFT